MSTVVREPHNAKGFVIMYGDALKTTALWYKHLVQIMASAEIDLERECTVIVSNNLAEVYAEMDSRYFTSPGKHKAVLVMGVKALAMFYNKKQIARKDGEVAMWNDLPVLFTYSQQEININRDNVYNYANHLQYFRLLMDQTTTPLVADYNFNFVPANYTQALDLLDKSTQVAYDIESTGLNPRKDHITVIGMAGRLTNGQTWTGIMRPATSPYTDMEFMPTTCINEMFRRVFKPTGHHLRFDRNMLMMAGGIDTPKCHIDTMHIAHYENDLQSKKLKHLLRAKLGAEPYEVGITFDKMIPFDKLTTYCRKDCLGTLLLAEYYEKEGYPVQAADGSHQLRAKTTLRPVIISYIMAVENLLQVIERRGVYLDQKMMATVKQGINTQIVNLGLQLDNLVEPYGMKGMNYGSPAQLQKLLYEKMGLPPVYKDEVVLETDDDDEEFEDGENEHKITTNAAALKQLAHNGSNICKVLLEYRKMKKMLDGFVVPWEDLVDPSSRLHPAYHSARTKTCRLSSSDPNLQQVSRDPLIRNLIAAPDGYVFIEADYSQIELRVVAVLGGIESMKAIYRAGGDIHTNTARAIAAMRGEDYDSLDKPTQKSYRTKAKAVNFGFVYGMSAKGFMAYAAQSYDVYLTLKEAQAFRDLYFRLYPELVRWHEKMKRDTNVTGMSRIATGRHRHLPNINSQSMYLRGKALRQGLNTPVQGLASEFTLHGMIEFEVAAVRNKINAQLVGQCHDAIFVEALEADADQVCRLLQIAMTDIKRMPLIHDNVAWDIPLEVEIKVGKCWGDPNAKIFSLTA